MSNNKCAGGQELGIKVLKINIYTHFSSETPSFCSYLHQIYTQMADQLNQYPDILFGFSEDELVTNQYIVYTTDHSGSSSHTSLEASNPVTENSLCIGMSFDTKESTVSYIKQYHIDNCYRFVVVESKSNKFICQCVDYKKSCLWRLRAAYSNRSFNWEIRKIDRSRTCLSTMQPADHVNLDSNQIGSIVMIPATSLTF